MLMKINRNAFFPFVRSLSFSFFNLEHSSGFQIVLILVDLLSLPCVVVKLSGLVVLHIVIAIPTPMMKTFLCKKLGNCSFFS